MNRNQVWLSVTLLSFILCLVLSGCGSTYQRKDDFKQLGLYGEHTLKRTEQPVSVDGKLSGTFFLGIGGVDGKVNSETKLKFYWLVNGNECYATTLPYNKIKFVIDNSYDIPSVEFIFQEFYENLNADLEHFHDPVRTNLNDIVSGYLDFAVVRLSQTTLENEIYLPK